MSPFSRQSTIRRKLALVLWGSTLLACAVAALGVGLYQRLTLKDRARKLMEPYAQTVAVGAAAAVEFEDPGRAQEILETLRANPEILAADISFEDGRVLASYNRLAGRKTVQHSHPADGVYLREDRAELLQELGAGARLHLSLGLDELGRQQQRTMWIFAAAMLVIAGITVGQMLVLQRTLIRPVADLSRTAEMARTHADYSHRVPAEGSDEIARLAQGFNAMMDAVADRQKALQELTTFQRAILDNAAYAIVSTAPDGSITSVNPAAERLLGYTAGELVGRQTPALWLDQEEMERHARRLSRELQEVIAPTMAVFVARARRNLPNEFEWQLIRKDGSRVPALINLTALRDEAGTITGFVALASDLTERKKAEAALREKTEELDRYFTKALDLLCIADVDGYFRRLNPQWEVVLGYRLAEMEGRNFADFVHPDDLEQTLRVMSRLAGQGEVLGFANRFRARDGSYRWIEWRAFPSGRAIYSVARDVTEQRRAEQALRESEASLAAAQERAHLGSWELDLETRTAVWSAEMSRLYYRDPALGPPAEAEFMEMIHPEDRARVLELQARIPGASGSIQMETRTHPALGPVRHLSTSADVVRDATGRAVRLVGTTLDVTEHKRAELRIRQLNRTYAVLSDINQTIVREQDLGAVLGSTCRIAVEKGGFRMASIGMLDGDRHVRIAAHAGANPETLQVLRALVEGDKPGCAFTRQVLQAGRHSVCNDVAGDPLAASWREAAPRLDFRSLAALPVKAGDEVIGLFTLFASEPGFFDADELRLLDELAMDISFALEVGRRERERHKAEEELRWKTAFFEAQADSALDGILIVDTRGRKVLQNQRVNEMWKIPPCIAENDDDATQVRYIAALTKDPQKFVEDVTRLYSHPDEINREIVELTDGTVLDRSSFPVRDKAGKHYGRIWAFRDITEQRKLQEQFLQAQKLEAIGQLAGGIAHDFNNVLTVIQGYGSLLMADPADAGEAAREIVQAAERAANLTRQLLAFSRRQVMQPRALDLNGVVTNLTKMLQRIVGEDVRLQLDLHPRPLVTRADAGMLDQVLLNLVVNARDAMPGGGRLFIETGEIVLTNADALSNPDASAGRYVSLRVTDTGSGIAPEHLPRVFEPFFSTKGPGRGTGLGLATVFGIVKQHGGAVRVESEIGRGSTFRVLLPAVAEAPAQPAATAVTSPPRGGHETILLVEDEPAVRLLTRAVLERAGYRVFEAAHGVEALKMAQRMKEPIHLLFTDIVMPEGLSGRDLAARLQSSHSGLRVVFTSGYSAEIAGRELSLQEGQNFIQKPSSPQQLLETVRRCLDN